MSGTTGNDGIADEWCIGWAGVAGLFLERYKDRRALMKIVKKASDVKVNICKHMCS